MSEEEHNTAAAFESYSTRVSLSPLRHWAPRYWPAWIFLLLLSLLALLPYKISAFFGKRLGSISIRLKARQRRIAERNIQVCFPELSTNERARLVEEHARNTGVSLVEMAMAWRWRFERLRPLIEINGREHLQHALDEGRGVILLAAHFTPIEIGIRAVEGLAPRIGGMYRAQQNSLADAIVRRGRGQSLDVLIDRNNVRQLLKLLKNNYVVFYLADQTHVGNQSEMISFFGEPAATNVAVTKLAKMSGATILPYFYRRLDERPSYRIDIGPALRSAPEFDRVKDTERFVALLENHIRAAPAQYFWTYKKFKNRPRELPDIYT